MEQQGPFFIQQQKVRPETKQQQHQQIKQCAPHANNPKNPFSNLRLWLSQPLQNLQCIRRVHQYNGMVINNAVFYSALEEGEAAAMEKNEVVEGNGECENEALDGLIEEKNEVVEGKGGCENGCGNDTFDELVGEKNEAVEGNGECENETCDDLIEEKGGEISSASEVLLSETAGHQEEEEEEQCQSSAEDLSPPPSMGWEVQEMDDASNCSSPHGSEEDAEKKDFGNEKFEMQQVPVLPALEVELMKERFAKLLLGEDMSGCGNGVPTALAISNAITNLCATLFGQLWRLEPLPPEKKAMWRREMEWLLCVSDHIVELKPTWQNFPDGTKLEVMTCRPRPDLYVNLPALRKLDNMLLEILDSFTNTEFRYVDQGVLAPDTDDDGSSSFRRALQRQEEKWWLPVPQVPPCGLHEDSRKQLQHRRDCTNQILKAAMAINSITLAEMEIPDTYLESLPKSARASLGDVIYRCITSDNFSPECLFACLDVSSEHQGIEIANRVEASMHIWHRKTSSKPAGRATRYSSRSSWVMFKDMIVEGDKRETLVERAESLLLSLKQRFPGLPQTTLDTSKIQCNKDVGKSILESYSRVLESLASNIVARIDDVLYVDDLAKHSDQFSCLSKIGAITHKGISVPYSVSVPCSPYNNNKSGFGGTPSCSPAKREKSSFMSKSNIAQQGAGVNKVSTDFLSVGRKGNKEYGCPIEKLVPNVTKFDEVPASFATYTMESSDCTTEEDVKRKALDQAWIE